VSKTIPNIGDMVRLEIHAGYPGVGLVVKKVYRRIYIKWAWWEDRESDHWRGIGTPTCPFREWITPKDFLRYGKVVA